MTLARPPVSQVQRLRFDAEAAGGKPSMGGLSSSQTYGECAGRALRREFDT